MTVSTTSISVRTAEPRDVPLLHEMIRELADFEHRLDEVVLETGALHAALFGPKALVEAVIAEVDGQPAGFALFLHTFSTFRGRPNLYIEDLFVRTTFRRSGIGQALVRHLAQAAVERGCGRLEWSVLTWNAAAIDFYRQLGAEPVTDWAVFELSGPALRRFAAGTR
jgi:GNAT superfamily N-acetyltransferase